MTKKQLHLCVLLLICIVFLSFYAINSFQTTSLANDLLTDMDYDKIHSGFVIDVASETLRDLEEEGLTALLATIKAINLKRVQKHSTNVDFIVALSGSGGACKLYLSNDGSLFIDGKLEETYQAVDHHMFDALLQKVSQ